MIIQDDRNDEQILSHPFLVIATDTFMSGWGLAEGGVSYMAWACREEDVQRAIEKLKARKEMRRVRVVYGSYRPKGKGHCHVYVFNP
jgi:hypothetical protein